MFKLNFGVSVLFLMLSSALWAADATAEKAGEAKVGEAPAKVLPQGALIFSVRPAGSMVMVNRLSTPTMSAWTVGQELMTGADQYAHLLLADRTVMTLGPNSNAVLQQEPVLATGANKSTIMLRRGALQVATSTLAVANGFAVSTSVGDAVAVGTDYNVEVGSEGGMDQVTIRVTSGLVNFQMKGQTYPIKGGEKRLFIQPSRADDAAAMTVRDMESQLDLLVDQAKQIKDDQIRALLAQAVTVNVMVKTGRVNFRVGEQEHPVLQGEKRTIVQPSTVFDPEALVEADYAVLLNLLDELAEKAKNETLSLTPKDKVLPQGATLFEVESSGKKEVQADGAMLRPTDTWKVGQEMVTTDEQKAHLILSDGTVLILGPKSKAQLQQTQISATGANASTIHLREGSLWVSTSKIATQSGFRVSTPLGEAVPVGTIFFVQVVFEKPSPRVLPEPTAPIIYRLVVSP